jgi:hypothetical protein
MTRSGSLIVASVLTVFAGYVVYQWGFNPTRAVKRRLNEVASSLSVPAQDSELRRVERLAQLRRSLAEDVQITAEPDAPAITSRDGAMSVVLAWRPPPGGANVQFVDTKVQLDSPNAARAHLTVEVYTLDRQQQPVVDARVADVALARRDGEWEITRAELRRIPMRP